MLPIGISVVCCAVGALLTLANNDASVVAFSAALVTALAGIWTTPPSNLNRL